MAMAHYGDVKSTFRKLGLADSFVHIWAMAMHVSRNIPLPYGYEDISPLAGRDLKKYVFPHHLDLILREVVLHAGRGPVSRSLARWEDLAAALNAIIRFGNEVFDERESDAVMLTMHRCAHQQFNISNPLDKQKIGRYLAFYRDESLARIFERRLGIGVDEYFLLAFGVLAGFMSRPAMNSATDFSMLGVSKVASSAFFARLVGSLPALRSALIEEQDLSSCWEYTRNAIHFRPLINVDHAAPERVYCPLPALLEQRLFAGIFYDIVEESEDFYKAYGSAFEALVGSVLLGAGANSKRAKPPVYHIGKRRMDGVDWLLSDDTAHVFVECKTKRITAAARTAATKSAVKQQIEVLAKAVFQNYRNIHDARKGAWELEHDRHMFYSLVVTLEDWHLFSPIASEMLRTMVADRLGSAGLPASMLDEIPYYVCSIEELEQLISVLHRREFREVLDGLAEEKHRGWMVGTYLRNAYPEARGADRVNFYAGFEDIVDQVIQGSLRAS